jgi:phosphoribosylanthranilate isomerase
MTWVKICGMTTLEDALIAVDAGADAVGFVFHEESPRCVSVETVREIVGKLPESLEKIGVFVDPASDPINILMQAGLTGTQCYFSEQGFAGSKARARAVGISCLPPHARFLMALPLSVLGNDESQPFVANLSGWKRNPAEVEIPEQILNKMNTFVLDSGDLRQPGGTGKTFDWNQAVPLAEQMKQAGINLVVAGGLNAANVGDAMGILQPWGVDVVSGVEQRPGKKDPDKVRAFVKAVRDFDRKAG